MIKQISQIEDEEYSKVIASHCLLRRVFQIRSAEHFRSLIDQVLDDDRNGRMLDADEVFAELEKEWGIEEEAGNR